MLDQVQSTYRLCKLIAYLSSQSISGIQFDKQRDWLLTMKPRTLANPDRRSSVCTRYVIAKHHKSKLLRLYMLTVFIMLYSS